MGESGQIKNPGLRKDPETKNTDSAYYSGNVYVCSLALCVCVGLYM